MDKSPRPALLFPARPTWCQHPREELQHLYSTGLRQLPDRLLCGLCGELLFVAN